MKYQYWFSNIKGIGNKTIHKILSEAESAQEVYFLSKEQLEKIPGIRKKEIDAILESKKHWNLDAAWNRLAERGIAFISEEMDTYPEKLRRILDAPYSLYYRGNLPDEKKKTVAIVGARGCSEYGRTMAKELGKQLGEQGVQVVSGMALGIDSAGHVGCLLGGGKTYAVLGCGVNICYPPGSQKLYHDIMEQGGILSEYPPGQPALSQLFPARNRIISALSDIVIVVEAKARSGSLITADFALEQGKDIYAVPGRMYDTLSEGCNRLIHQGAGIISSVEDFLKELEISTQIENNQGDFRNLLLEKDELLVYSCLDLQPKNLEELMKMTALSFSELLAVLSRLTEREFISETFKNYYIRRI